MIYIQTVFHKITPQMNQKNKINYLLVLYFIKNVNIKNLIFIIT